MKYRSTRGGVSNLSFVEAVMMGLAPDKGLLVPERVPKVDAATLEKWKTLEFHELAVEIMSLYISRDEIGLDDLKTMAKEAYSTFRSKDVTPVVDLSKAMRSSSGGGASASPPPNKVYLLELFHGPTFAFKDVALQFLGRLFEFILREKKEPLTILGATSGDTGSSAIQGVRGRANVECFILYPENRTSKIQEAQMATVADPNVHAVALREAEFDDCQKIVKALFADASFRADVKLGAVNSINWARILAQITYYFYATFKLLEEEKNEENIWFSVPTGNFGDVLAGYYAKEMGLPSCGGLIVATNDNDILCKFFQSGVYARPEAGATPTLAPSMDICVSSNFERFLYHCGGNDPSKCAALMADFERTGRFQADGPTFDAAKSHMVSGSVDEDALLDTIRRWHDTTGYVLDPHTAVGVCAGLRLRPDDNATLVCLACAHHAKFPGAVEKAIGKNAIDALTPETALTDLLHLPLRNAVVTNDLDAVKDFILTTLAERRGGPAGEKQ
mmetsp:Transcript_7827/g.25710  ORF Transcript_7827/g.25710 Transcript_7827/m.25710 type:complete len:504 (+) Transcript_7827:57-1568(+)